jgi:hypothetical protein
MESIKTTNIYNRFYIFSKHTQKNLKNILNITAYNNKVTLKIL